MKPSSASRSPGVTWNSSSIITAVITLAPTATQAPWATWRRRSTAPAFARNVMSAATSRIASNPSRSSNTNDSMNRFAAEPRSATSRSARSRPESRRAWIASSSSRPAPPAARARSAAKASSKSLASAAFRARTSVSTCSNVM